jgi:LDH2 family malate/lactate/ureidoglycolate dehydrogenase
MPVLQPMPLADYTSRIFEAAGTPKMTADLVGQSLVSANLAGHDSHGVIRIMQYLRQIDSDEIRPLARPEIERETPVMTLFNGHRCFGQLAAKVAIENGIDKARGNAVAAVALKHSGHVGRLGEWVGLAADDGLIALAYANGGRSGGLVAPFGGAERRMGTNPVAVAIPLQDRPAVLLDFATSAVAEGKVRVALNSGKPIPEGWALDKHGAPTQNPADLYDGGMLLPAAGHKGYSLALLTDILGGILTGAGGPSLPGTILGNGVLFILLNIDAFRPLAEFFADGTIIADRIKSTRPAPGFDEVLLPGEPEARSAHSRQDNGIPLDDTTWEQIVEAAHKLGVADIA